MRLKDGFVHQFQACLHHSVGDSWNAEATKFPFAFGIITCRTSTGRNSPRLQRVPATLTDTERAVVTDLLMPLGDTS